MSRYRKYPKGYYMLKKLLLLQQEDKSKEWEDQPWECPNCGNVYYGLIECPKCGDDQYQHE